MGSVLRKTLRPDARPAALTAWSLHQGCRIHQLLGFLTVFGGERHDSVSGVALDDVQALNPYAGVLELLGYFRQSARFVREPED